MGTCMLTFWAINPKLSRWVLFHCCILCCDGSSLDLKWMISQEHPQLPKKPSDPPVQFWLKHEAANKATKEDYWLNVTTRTPQSATPVLGRGGILADGMGLGKCRQISHRTPRGLTVRRQDSDCLVARARYHERKRRGRSQWRDLDR